MKDLTVISLAFFIFLFIALNTAIAGENSQPLQLSAPAMEQDQNSTELEEKKKELREDARKLAQNFREIFENITGISRAILLPFIDDVSEWIENNYAELSRKSRQRLEDSMEELRKQLNKLENQSREKTRELFQDFQELLNSLQEKEEEKVEPEMMPA